MNAKYWLPLTTAVTLLAGCGPRESAAEKSATAAPTSTPSAPMPPEPLAEGSNATAQLAPTQGHETSGSLTLTASGDSVHITGALLGLPPSTEVGFHIHEKGDCSAPDASSAGGHFNPTNAQHGNPQGAAHHAGDMLNAKSDAQGNAKVDAVATGVSLDATQPNSVHGKAIVVHEKADDYASQPAGNSGARIACGVIS